MKIKALAVLAVLSAGAVAHATSFNYTDGDFLVGFNATSGTGNATNLVIDLGNIPFTSPAPTGGTALSLNISADLTAVYGSQWTNNSTLTYGIIGAFANDSFDKFGTPNAANTLYASADSSASAWALDYPSSLASPVGNLQLVANQMAQDSYTGNQFGILDGAIRMAKSETYSWDNVISSGYVGNYFQGSVVTGVGSYLTIYQLYPSFDNAGNDAPVFGAASLSSTGQLVITTVPEPSTYALMGLGALLFIIAYRRKNA